MPNKPLYRALIIAGIVLLIAGLWYFCRKATWIKLIKGKYPDGDAKNWTEENAATLWTLPQLIGMYFTGHPALEPKPENGAVADVGDSAVRAMKRGVSTARETKAPCDVDVLKGP